MVKIRTSTGSPVVRILYSLPRTWVRSLVRELRSHKPCNAAKKKKKKVIIEGRRRKGRQRTRWLDCITDSMDMSSSKLGEMVKDRGAWHTAVHGVAMSRTHMSS